MPHKDLECGRNDKEFADTLAADTVENALGRKFAIYERGGAVKQGHEPVPSTTDMRDGHCHKCHFLVAPTCPNLSRLPYNAGACRRYWLGSASRLSDVLSSPDV